MILQLESFAGALLLIADIPVRLQAAAVVAWFVVAAAVGMSVFVAGRVFRLWGAIGEVVRRALATTLGCFAGAQAAIFIGGPYLLCGGQPSMPMGWREQLFISAVIGVALGIGTVMQDRMMGPAIAERGEQVGRWWRRTRGGSGT